MAIGTGLKKSLGSIEITPAHLEYLNQEALYEILNKYVLDGKLVNTSELFYEGKYEQFGEALGDFIKFSMNVAEKNHMKH